MAYTIRPNEGIHFSFGPWVNCVVGAYDTGGVGEVIFVGIGAIGAMEYDAVSIIWGPGDLNAVGDLGAFLNSLIPAANTALQSILNTKPHDPAVQHTDPPTIQNVNRAFRQYYGVIPSSDGTHPVIQFTPYNP